MRKREQARVEVRFLDGGWTGGRGSCHGKAPSCHVETDKTSDAQHMTIVNPEIFVSWGASRGKKSSPFPPFGAFKKWRIGPFTHRLQSNNKSILFTVRTQRGAATFGILHLILSQKI